MSDGWRNDDRRYDPRYGDRRWDRQNDGQYADRGGLNRQPGQDDFGRESDYGAGYATPRARTPDLNRRPGGMDDRDDWRADTRRFDSTRNPFADFRNRFDANRRSGSPSYGSRFADYPADYEDYGDWQQGGVGLGGTSAAFGRDYAGDRNFDDRRPHDRSFWDRASDEVASWAGDHEAGQRRDMDRQRGHAGRGPKGYTRSDDRIREDVNDRLTDDWRVDASNVEVAVHSGEVTLAGTVGSRDEKRRAEDLVEAISGVRHVQNNLRINDSWRDTSAGQSVSTPVGSSGSSTSLAGGIAARPLSGNPGVASSGAGTVGGTPGTPPNSTH